MNDQLILEAGRVKDGTRALVTGGGSGIGQSIAMALKSAGAGVLVCDADPSTNPDFVVDIVEEAAVERMFIDIEEQLGGLDVLVNNVGIAGPAGLVDEISTEDFDRVLDVNVGGTFRVTCRAVPLLRASGGGLIVNLASTAGIFPYPYRSPYVAVSYTHLTLPTSDLV